MSTSDANQQSDVPPVSRDELITMVARAHGDSAYGESTLAGRTLAAQSKLPRIIAENLGAGFGQWDFFPEAVEIVDFAFRYAPPSTEEEVWAMARSWASDDAAGRHTLMALVGREILQHELRRIDVPKLRELFDEARPSRALELRASLGLEVPAASTAGEASTRRKPTTTATSASPNTAAKRAPNAPRAGGDIPLRMPKPEFKPPPKAAPPPPPKRYQHPKFGEGVLVSQDGVGEDAKLTIKFEAGPKTLLARFVTEVSPA